MTPDTLHNLKAILGILDNNLTKKDFINSFESVVKIIKEIKKQNAEDMKRFNDLCSQAIDKLNNTIIKKISNIKVRDGKDGKDGAKGERGESPAIDTDQIAQKASEIVRDELLPLIPDILTIMKELPQAGEVIRDGLELLPKGDKLKIEAIENLAEELEELRKLRTRNFGGGGGLSANALALHFINDETPSGLINEINTDFVLNYTPSPTDSLKVYRGGARQRITEDYTLSGKTITFLTAPVVGEIILCDYMR